MKHTIKIALLCGMIAFLAASCADDTPLEFQITKPLSIADVEFLNDYDALKTYVDRTANPNFYLGSASSVSDINDKGLKYRLLISNFDQIALNNEMMHGTVLGDDGALVFGSIPALLTNADDAGISVFGRTLVSHSQQKAAYLNSLLTDDEEIVWVKIPGTSDHGEKILNGDFKNDTWNTSFRANGSGTTGALTADGQGPYGQGRALMITNPAVQSDGWRSQMIIVWDTPMKEGDTWTFKMDYKSDAACSYGNQAQAGLGNYMHGNLVPTVNSTSAWQSLEITWTVEARSNNCTALAFDLGLNATSYYFGNVSLYKHPVIEEIEMLTNGDFKDDTWNTSFKANGSGTTGELTADGQGPSGRGRALMITNPEVRTDGWRSQMIIVWDTQMKEGETWKFTMDYKSDVACSYGNQAQSGLGNYMHNNLVPTINSTTSWQTLDVTWEVEARSNNCTALAFDLGLNAATYYFGNVSLIKIQEGGTPDQWVEEVTKVPKTPEKKTEIITGEMERWIEGIMEITGDYIKDWELVSSPMDDANPSELKTGTNPGSNEFYWQDYLGKNYARVAAGLARQYGSSGLKLFVNDYGLETNSAKCQGLLDMINYWESDNTTRIDGIGVQLNLSYSLDATTQASNEAGIVTMLNLLKNSGKLIKISALDMAIKDATGATINTANVTRAQQLAMSRYYNFVIRKYFEIIPAAQRYGITSWNTIESTGSAGLWSSDYSRKFTFSGFADGLAGRDVSHE